MDIKMAYNLRTGLFGSGDVDINVSLDSLTAENITSGTFSVDRIPTLGDSKISSLSSVKLTGEISTNRIPGLQASKIASGELDPARIPALTADKITSGTLNADRIPDLFTTKITGGIFDLTRIPALPANQITSGTFAASSIPALDATKITTGTFGSADRIPTLPSSKIDATTTFAKSMINSTGEWGTNDIPDLSADKITSDTLSIDRIPDIPTSKITPGHLDLDGNDLQDVNELKFIASSGNKITGYGTYKTAVTNCDLSSVTNDFPRILDYRCDMYEHDITDTYSHPHTALRSTNCYIPTSQTILVEVDMYYAVLSDTGNAIVGRLCVSGTNDEIWDEEINDLSLCYPTSNTSFANNYESALGRRTVSWILRFPSAKIGNLINLEPQFKTTQSTGAKFISGRSGSGSSLHDFGLMSMTITAIPTTAFEIHIHDDDDY